jgi:hypothetical protein
MQRTLIYVVNQQFDLLLFSKCNLLKAGIAGAAHDETLARMGSGRGRLVIHLQPLRWFEGIQYNRLW